jgi:protein-disulfide isomerase
MKRLIALSSLLVAAAFVRADEPIPTFVYDPPAAVVAGSTIPSSAVDKAGAESLRKLAEQQYLVRRQALESLLFDDMLAREAEALGVASDALLQAQVENKVVAPSEQEKKDFYDQNTARMGGRPYEDVKAMIEEHLTEQSRSARRADYIRALKAKYRPTILLSPARVAVDPSDDPAQGSKKAPVLLVVFSDFQCPHCAKHAETMRRLESLYGSSVRLVFRDFPLAMHADAPRAAEAAACADAQKKFWPYHDLLFANQDDLSVEGLKALAARAKLNVKKFDACLSSGQFSEEWRKDAEDGKSYGVTGTPTLFVNGRLMFGNQSFENYVQAVDDELLARGLPLPGAEKLPAPKASGKSRR